jgi:hypothetical protein
MTEKLDVTDALDDVWPICPHCRAFLGFGNINWS